MSGGAIHEAATRNDPHKVVELLEAGVSAESVDEEGSTPLHRAATAGAFEAARALIDRRAEVDCVDALGRTPLLLAVDNFDGQGALIELLRFAGANPHRKAIDGRSPVSAARAAGSDVARFFASIRELPSLPEFEPEPEPATDESRQRRGSGLFGKRRPN